MKKKNLNFLLALLAALALVFAGACSDGSDDSDNPSGDGNGNNEKTAVTTDDVEALLKSIESVDANDENPADTWDFSEGTLALSDGAYTFTVEYSESASQDASAIDTLAAVQALGTVTKDPVQVTFSDGTAEGSTATAWDENTAPSSTNSGYITVEIELTDAESYSLPSALSSVTIEFKVNSSKDWE